MILAPERLRDPSPDGRWLPVLSDIAERDFPRPVYARGDLVARPVVQALTTATYRGLPLTLAMEWPWIDRHWIVQNVLLYTEGIAVGYVRLRTVTAAALAQAYPTPLDYLREVRGHCGVYTEADLAKYYVYTPAQAPRALHDAEDGLARLRAFTEHAVVDFAYVADGSRPEFPVAMRRQGILATTYLALAQQLGRTGLGLYSPDSPSSEATPVWAWLERRGYPVTRRTGPSSAYRALQLDAAWSGRSSAPTGTPRVCG